MSYDNIEIEVKIEVNQTDFEKARKQLNRIASFKGVSQQVDTYYSSKEPGFLGREKFPYKWLSIRKRNDKTIINHKYYYPEGVEKHLYCDEFETELDDMEMINRLFKFLGVKKIVVVNKKREIFIFRDEFEVALDTVAELGYFIEVEALKDQGGIKNTKHKIENFISLLNINKYSVDYRGYPFSIFEKHQK